MVASLLNCESGRRIERCPAAERLRRNLKYAKNPELYNEINRRSLSKNRERRRLYEDEYRKLNPEKISARHAKRYASRKGPNWLSAEDRLKILEIYQESSKLSIATGIPHQVDHVVPLCGGEVCGLHVPWNLRILTAVENNSRPRRYKDVI